VEAKKKGFSRVKNVLDVNAPRFFIPSASSSAEGARASGWRDMMKFLQYFYHIINSERVPGRVCECVVVSSTLFMLPSTTSSALALPFHLP
jgi:hypothetical protein